jgi:hypothetical protein
VTIRTLRRLWWGSDASVDAVILGCARESDRAALFMVATVLGQRKSLHREGDDHDETYSWQTVVAAAPFIFSRIGPTERKITVIL